MDHEILVHISAPATQPNDALYRSLADAYVDFEPYRILGGKPRQQQNAPDQPIGPEMIAFAGGSKTSPDYAATGTSILSTSKDSYGSFPSHLSSEDQAKGYQQTGVRHNGSSDDDSIPPSSRLARLERIHTKWKQQTTPKSSFLGAQRRIKQAPSYSDDADTAFIEDTQLAAQALQSQLQDTYSTTSEDTSEDGFEPESELNQNHPSGVSCNRQSVNKETMTVVASVSSTPYAEPGSVGAGLEDISQPNTTLALSNPTDHVNEGDRSRLIDRTLTLELLDFAKLPVDAYPPAPRVSVARPGTLPSQVTKHLAAIKAQNPTRFKLSKKLRSPKSDDRGYWAINCTKWPNKLQHEFWSTLFEHVVSGSLGWGTTLHRESKSPRALGQLRLYCWGEVVEHMWLVLWLCSKGKVSGSGSQWIDADGVVVLEVP